MIRRFGVVGRAAAIMIGMLLLPGTAWAQAGASVPPAVINLGEGSLNGRAKQDPKLS